LLRAGCGLELGATILAGGIGDPSGCVVVVGVGGAVVGAGEASCCGDGACAGAAGGDGDAFGCGDGACGVAAGGVALGCAAGAGSVGVGADVSARAWFGIAATSAKQLTDNKAALATVLTS